MVKCRALGSWVGALRDRASLGAEFTLSSALGSSTQFPAETSPRRIRAKFGSSFALRKVAVQREPPFTDSLKEQLLSHQDLQQAQRIFPEPQRIPVQNHQGNCFFIQQTCTHQFIDIYQGSVPGAEDSSK